MFLVNQLGKPIILVVHSVIRTGPEPAKPAGLTGLQGWPVRSANFFEKTGFFSRPGMEPARTGRSGLGIQETQFFFKKPENKTLLMYFGASLLMYFGSEPQRCIALGAFLDICNPYLLYI